MKIWVVPLLVSLTTSGAFGFAECDGALVMSTYSESASYSRDWRLAKYLKDREYRELKRDADVDYEIYGIPVGNSYSDFQNNYRMKQAQRNESLSEQQFREILITGLDPQSSSVYRTCIEGHMGARQGFHAAVMGSKSPSSVMVLLKWTVPERSPGRLQWIGLPPDHPALPETMGQGELWIGVQRQRNIIQVGANAIGTGYTSNLITVSPPPPRLRFVDRTIYFVACLANDGQGTSGCWSAHLADAFQNAPSAIRSVAQRPDRVFWVTPDDQDVNLTFPAINEGKVVKVVHRSCSVVGGNKSLEPNMRMALKEVTPQGRVQGVILANYVGTINDRFRAPKDWSLAYRCDATFMLEN